MQAFWRTARSYVSVSRRQPCRNLSAAVSGYTPPPEFRSHFHALPDCRETARGQPRPSLSAALFPLLALRSTSVLAHPRGRKLLSGGFRLYAVRLRREPIIGRSHAESGAEVRFSTVQQVPIARLRAGHPYLFRAASEKPIGLFEESSRRSPTCLAGFSVADSVSVAILKLVDLPALSNSDSYRHAALPRPDQVSSYSRCLQHFNLRRGLTFDRVLCPICYPIRIGLIFDRPVMCN